MCVCVCVCVLHRCDGVSIHLCVSSLPSEAQQLLVLAGDEVDGGVFQQRREHEQQTHRHPDIDGFDVGHLKGGEEELEASTFD